jgi:hypothetical protein
LSPSISLKNKRLWRPGKKAKLRFMLIVQLLMKYISAGHLLAIKEMGLYYSPYFDQNIWRRGSSLTGERTKKDPAFKGFRQRSSRLKEASPIAASLYKRVHEQVKQYALYRTLTGEAIKMLKEGMQAAVITETLKKKYIDPLSGLIYPGRLPECKKIKIWLRLVDSSVLGSGSWFNISPMRVSLKLNS